METQFPLPKGAQQPSNFQPMSVVAKWLDGSGFHLIRRKASAQATLLHWDPAPSTEGAQQPPQLFGACSAGVVAFVL